jgi:LuxR family maltose regulon positive regulatory protein
MVAMYRAAQARLRHDRDGTLLHAGRALALAGADDHVGRGAAQALLGLAHWSDGDVDEAALLYRGSLESLRRTGSVADVLGCTIGLADLELSRGRLSQAYAAYEQGLAAAQLAPSPPQGTADMHTGLATLLLERGRTAPALKHLRAGAELADSTGLPQHASRWRLAMAEVRQLDGDTDGALVLLDEAERLHDTDFSPDVRPVGAVRARAWLRQGRTADARAWARGRGLTADDEPSYLREYEHLTLARILLHDGTDPRRSAQQLEGLLHRLLAAAEAAGRIGAVMEVLVLQSLAEQAARRADSARTPLRRALALAQPHGYVRLITEHGRAAVEVLRSVAADTDTAGYVRQLLEDLGADHGAGAADRRPDQLSERELEVLRLLASALDGPEIARTLVVSVNTVRTHTRSIYTKLGVSSRRSAVHRAQDLGLLSRRQD